MSKTLDFAGGQMTLLPPSADVCQQCSVKHEPEMPHNQDSLYWQYNFYFEHGRWPTWADALTHCTPQMRDIWIRELAKRGIEVGEVSIDEPAR